MSTNLLPAFLINKEIVCTLKNSFSFVISRFYFIAQAILKKQQLLFSLHQKRINLLKLTILHFTPVKLLHAY